jgi:group I intron endonuclease
MHIYKFTHIESGRVYIGQTIQDPNQRRLEHIADSRYTTKEYHFHNAIRKYGIEAFKFEVIDSATSLQDLNILEDRYIKEYNSIENGFNIRQAGGNKLHSEESKKRMSNAQKEAHAKRKAEGRDTFVKSKKTSGWKWSDEHREKISTARKGLKKGQTWEEIYGIEGAKLRRESHMLKAKLRKEKVAI